MQRKVFSSTEFWALVILALPSVLLLAADTQIFQSSDNSVDVRYLGSKSTLDADRREWFEHSLTADLGRGEPFE